MTLIERDLNRRKAIRDALREAERERDHWADATMRLGEENTELRRQLAGAVDALAVYGRHHDYCRSQRVLDQRPCNCGYEAARSAVFGGQ